MQVIEGQHFYSYKTYIKQLFRGLDFVEKDCLVRRYAVIVFFFNLHADRVSDNILFDNNRRKKLKLFCTNNKNNS